MTTTITLTPPAAFINANECPACPFPDDRRVCCHDGAES